MKKILLYWNHICILHNFEKKYLQALKEKLIQEDIELEVRFFGLGYSEHMSEYLAKDDAQLPDLIVSADLEVYENKQLFHKLGELYNTLNWFELRKDRLTTSTIRKETLLPIVAIPLVCYTTELERCSNQSILEVKGNFAFGGINNSAGKTVVKAVWELYGKEQADYILECATVYDMPIGAFQSVRAGVNQIALVPSLYAMRADHKNSFSVTFKEGAFMLPSYFAARTTIDEDTGKKVAKALLSEELLEIYAQNGDLHICIENIVENRYKVEKYCCVSQEFLDKLDDKVFYEVYTSRIPTAKLLPIF